MAVTDWRRWTAWLDVAPSSGEVRIVRLKHGDGDIDASQQVLSEAEQERAAGISSERWMRQFVTTRASLRTLLGMICRQDPRTVPIGLSGSGKPIVFGEGDGGGVRFNVSHGGGVSLLAFATGREIGIDIELIEAKTDVMGIARRFFKGADIDFLVALEDQDECCDAFHRLWTQREAMAKAHGSGLNDTVFEAPLLPLLQQQVVALDGTNWQLCCLTLARQHAVALAVEGSADVRLSFWEAPDLTG
ncbi:MAG: 4'-phosphopantetheinyl transferase family protein [Alphaproteobacteria bacterium]